MISAIIFDCDGVLVDSEVLAYEIENEVLSTIGLHYDPHDFVARFMGSSNDTFFRLIDEDAQARLGRSVEDEIRPLIHAAMEKAVTERLKEVPGALQAIAAVKHLKAVASSSTALALDRKLKMVKHWDHFAPHIYSADHVTHAKPAPDLFLHAAAMLDVKPAECLVLEDSINGVKAAVAAGMQVWGFTGGGHMPPRMADKLSAAGATRIVGDWAEAARLFAVL